MNILGVSAAQGALLFPFLHSKKYKILANIEPRGVFHTSCESQWKLNFRDIPFYRGFCLQEFDEKVDIVVASPDGGIASIMRLSKVNKSLNLVIQSILHYKPKIFLIENLPRLLSLLPKEYLQKTLEDYKLIFHERSVLDYGNSQESRKRLLIIGVHKNR